MFGLAVEAKEKAAKFDHQNLAWLAWHTATLTGIATNNPKKMPTLESLTGTRSLPPVQTPEQMRAVFARMRERGGKHA